MSPETYHSEVNNDRNAKEEKPSSSNQQQEREARAREVLAIRMDAVGYVESARAFRDDRESIFLREVVAAMLAFSDAERTAAAAPASERGWRLVPVEPTEVMLAKGASEVEVAWVYSDDGKMGAADVWSAMLAAAPQAEPEHVTSAAGVRVDEGGGAVSGTWEDKQ